MTETAIYIHIPFCDHKCIYCDFYSITPLTKTNEYLYCLKREIDFYAEKYGRGRKIISIFFGGGTPSLMEPAYIKEIIDKVKSSFTVAENAEITLETNPGTVNRKKVEGFINGGINRISIGIQSFDNRDLEFLTRIHDSTLAEKTVFYAYDAGCHNISLDLIFNLPGQTLRKWSLNLQRAIALPINHISAYSLILERGTILNKMVLDGKVKIQDEDTDAKFYEHTIDFLSRHGFRQYEVSNFAKEGFECVHNNAYWRYKDYLGFGTSAHSFAGSSRWWNYSSLSLYNNAVNEKGEAVAASEILTGEQMLEEYIMLALRSKGINLDELEARFGGGWLKANESLIASLIESGLLINENNFLKLSPKGYTICDEILTRFS